MTTARPRVVVGMSGGVDSSVAAAVLVEQGYDVIGIAMRLWGGESTSGCCSLDDFLDARRVSAQLGIPFYVMDFRAEFDRTVVDPFVQDYLAGRTPSPCVRCNQFVKFASFRDRARELGAQYVATGHYARVARDPETGRAELWRARDRAKDQSYFLFTVQSDVLEHTLFPVGDLTKEQVRDKARALGLSVADKPESQEICFAPKGRYAEFVAARAGVAPQTGAIVDGSGKRIGQHDGVHRFTIGQRRGLGVSAPEPLYVTGIDAGSGEVKVGPKTATVARGLVARRTNWIDDRVPSVDAGYQVKIRSRFEPTPVRLCSADGDSFTIECDGGLAAVTPGQAAVLYSGERVVGGGWIESGLK
jgi:tRNA-specific 2-thiouridylase